MHFHGGPGGGGGRGRRYTRSYKADNGSEPPPSRRLQNIRSLNRYLNRYKGTYFLAS